MLPNTDREFNSNPTPFFARDRNMRNKEEILKSQAWHEEILNEREVALNAGRTIASDWEEAKERIKKNIAKYRVEVRIKGV